MPRHVSARTQKRASPARGAPLRIGIDTGGTFTDLVLERGGRRVFLKVPSTPDDPARAVLEGLARLEANLPGATVVHGSTVATNALLERKGGPTALVTTAGFEDLLEIGRQARPDLYNWNVLRPEPLVARRLRHGVRERVHPREGRTAPGAAELRRLRGLAARLVRAGVRSVAVCFLHSYLDGRNESAAGRALARRGLAVTLSHRIAREFREYERFSTACANAFLQPVMGGHLSALNRRVRGTLRVLGSGGLTGPARRLAAEPVHAVLSGPAGGVLAARSLGRAAGTDRLIAFDMGGTSTDVSLLDGRLPLTVDSRLAGVPLHVPAVAVESVGAGGGSIARVDEGGALRVGPESAGADPGPACYGRGDLATVTDANLLLGRLGERDLLGGEMVLDAGRARRAIERVARAASLGTLACAEGIVAVANAGMERALRAVSMQRGHDPRAFALVCYGGAGGLHACALADSLGIRTIVLPVSPGTFSAFGMVLAPAGCEEALTVMLDGGPPGRRPDPAVRRRLESGFADLERRAEAALRREGIPRGRLRFERSADLRYRGQAHELTVPGGSRSVARFHDEYRRLYGESREDTPVEIVTLRVRAQERARPARSGRGGARGVAETASRSLLPRPVSRSPVVIGGRRLKVPAYRRDDLGAGARIAGPARVIEYSSTFLLAPGWSARRDREGNLLVTRG